MICGYYSSIECKEDNFRNSQELHRESKSSKSYLVNLKMLYIYSCRRKGGIPHGGLDYLKYYIYSCRCKGGIQHGGLDYLKYYIKIEDNSTFYMSPKTERAN
jgi:hypothetical protein